MAPPDRPAPVLETPAVDLDFPHLGQALVGADGLVLQASPSLQKLLGLPRRLIEGRPLADVIHPEDRTRCAERLQEAFHPEGAAREHRDCALRLVPGDAGIRWVDLTLARAAAPVAGPLSVLLTDITARKQAEASLLRSESLLREAQTTARMGSFHWDALTQQVTWSDELFRIYGRTPGQFVPTLETYLASIHPDDLPRVTHHLRQAMDQRTEFAHDYRMVLPDGGVRWVHARGRPVLAADGTACGLQGTCQDITARKRDEEALQATLQEKEALLRELNHRVKNNLQLVSSLLRLEHQHRPERAAQDVLDGMQGRIRSMALLHECLYRPGLFATVELAAYLRELATHALHTRNRQADPVQAQLQLDLQAVHVPMDQAMPCGLLVNELLCNSLKHAFPDGRAGTIRIRLQAAPEGSNWCLEVGDDGVGLPPADGGTRPAKVGLQLAADLADQLGGRLDFDRQGPGSRFRVVFEPATTPGRTPA
ncbi:MAG: PAS domain-containing protein [Rhodoferax sp.]|nr:PAS domain-containing protein [Rhodoferax sp.]